MQHETTNYQTMNYKGICVCYRPHLDGGGKGFGQEFLRVMKERFKKVDHLFEFCAGPGFIGFSLLANDFCNRLTLSDINPEACQACAETVRNNGLENKVTIYVSDVLDKIPEHEKWDLVVSNPPHWQSMEDARFREGYSGGNDIRKFDFNFEIHKRFFRDVRKHLKPDGSILLQENGLATKVEDFSEMIEENKLKIIDTFKAKPLTLFQCMLQGKGLRYTKPSHFFFMWIRAR